MHTKFCQESAWKNANKLLYSKILDNVSYIASSAIMLWVDFNEVVISAISSL